jgi:hypothetical protein
LSDTKNIPGSSIDSEEQGEYVSDALNDRNKGIESGSKNGVKTRPHLPGREK